MIANKPEQAKRDFLLTFSAFRKVQIEVLIVSDGWAGCALFDMCLQKTSTREQSWMLGFLIAIRSEIKALRLSKHQLSAHLECKSLAFLGCFREFIACSHDKRRNWITQVCAEKCKWLNMKANSADDFGQKSRTFKEKATQHEWMDGEKSFAVKFLNVIKVAFSKIELWLRPKTERKRTKDESPQRNVTLSDIMQHILTIQCNMCGEISRDWEKSKKSWFPSNMQRRWQQQPQTRIFTWRIAKLDILNCKSTACVKSGSGNNRSCIKHFWLSPLAYKFCIA